MALTRLGYRGPSCDVYVRVGFDASSIYSLIIASQPVTILCLEAINADRAAVQRPIAPESHH